MKKFEYRKFESSGSMSVEMLCNLGNEGWEMITEYVREDELTPYVQIFKREIEG